MTYLEMESPFQNAKWRVYPKLESTNSFVLENKPPVFTVVQALSQTLGRGQFERKFISQREDSLTFSIALPPNLASYFTLIAGVCMCETLEQIGVYPKLKWPNDLYFKHKFGGILVESKNDISVLGIGLNINPIQVPGIQTSSLLEEFGNKVDPAKVLRLFLRELNGYWFLYQKYGFEKLVEKWNKLDFLIGKTLVVDSIKGKGLGINSSGAYKLGTSIGVLEIMSGSVNIEST